MSFITATDCNVEGEEKDKFWLYKPFFKRAAEVWHSGAVCESGQCPQLWDLGEMSWKRPRFKPEVYLWLWNEGFSKTSCAFHELPGLGRWPLPIEISTDVRTGAEFDGRVQSLPKPIVNLLTKGILHQVLRSDAMWEATDKSMKQNGWTLQFISEITLSMVLTCKCSSVFS